jgi:hypothetical protein
LYAYLLVRILPRTMGRANPKKVKAPTKAVVVSSDTGNKEKFEGTQGKIAEYFPCSISLKVYNEGATDIDEGKKKGKGKKTVKAPKPAKQTVAERDAVRVEGLHKIEKEFLIMTIVDGKPTKMRERLYIPWEKVIQFVSLL